MAPPSPDSTAGANGRRLKTGTLLAGLLGLAIFVVLIASQDLAELGELWRGAGWGIIALTVFTLLRTLLSALAWRAVYHTMWRGATGIFVFGRFVREAINAILPVAQVGGDIVGARILIFRGAKAHLAAAGVVVDMTLEFVAHIAFTAIGLALLLLRGGGAAVVWVLVALAVAIPAAGAVLMAQRWGAFRLLQRLIDGIAARVGLPTLGARASLHDAVMAIYARRGVVATATAWHLAAWMIGAVEVWLLLLLLGVDATFAEALIIETAGRAIRAGAFLIPAGLGVQEGGYILAGALFGVPPAAALSVSLVKRLRDVTLGVPAILAWQVVEGRRLLRSVS